MERTEKFAIAIMALIVSATALGELPLSKDIITMVQEMQRADYFTFVMLLNMVQDKIPPNATFLMPTDRALSRTPPLDNNVLEFLLRHAIPSPLLFDDMRRFPSDTMVPTYKRDYMLKIINGGRRRFYLNNVRITGINICTAGSSFRCHGISDVLHLDEENRTTATCPKSSPPTAAGPSSPPPLDLSDGFRRSNSPAGLFRLLLTTMLSSVVLSTKFPI